MDTQEPGHDGAKSSTGGIPLRQKLIALACLAVTALAIMSAVRTGRSGKYRGSTAADRKAMKTFVGMREIGFYLTQYAAEHGRSFGSFQEFHGHMKERWPDAVADLYADNPFPGFLPEGRYERLAKWPQNVGADTVPLMWDTLSNRVSQLRLLYLNGYVEDLGLGEITGLVESMQRQGQAPKGRGTPAAGPAREAPPEAPPVDTPLR